MHAFIVYMYVNLKLKILLFYFIFLLIYVFNTFFVLQKLPKAIKKNFTCAVLN